MNTLIQDLKYGLRMLGKAPGFTLVAVLTLALGIGANTAIFSVVYAALLRPLPYFQPNRLITLTQSRGQDSAEADQIRRSWNSSYPDFQDWAAQSKSIQPLAGFGGDGFLFNGVGEPQLLDAAQASTNFFSMLGVKPMLGRDFAAGEDVPNNPKVAMLTYGFWRSQFGGDPNAVGRTITLDGNAVTIIGVLPRTFEFAPAGDAALWVPLHLNQDMATRRN
ncbi:MAG TPA: ABC transporter permease, partial [Candidatus Methylomirabilis sp.]|nr:ABC transporter permease [Candidatus Methylomirabilis sp.]